MNKIFRNLEFHPSSPKPSYSISSVNPLVPNGPILYPLKTSGGKERVHWEYNWVKKADSDLLFLPLLNVSKIFNLLFDPSSTSVKKTKSHIFNDTLQRFRNSYKDLRWRFFYKNNYRLKSLTLS